MAIKVGGTEVVDNNRQLKNIASVDATTVAALGTAGVGGGGGVVSMQASGGNITAGDVVALNSNGTVTSISVAGGDDFLATQLNSGTTFSGASINFVMDVYHDSSNSKLIMLVRTSGGVSGISIATLSNGLVTAITTPVVLRANSSSFSPANGNIAYNSTDGYYLATYGADGNGYVYHSAFSVSGTSVTVHNAVEIGNFYINQGAFMQSVYDSGNNRFMTYAFSEYNQRPIIRSFTFSTASSNPASNINSVSFSGTNPPPSTSYYGGATVGGSNVIIAALADGSYQTLKLQAYYDNGSSNNPYSSALTSDLHTGGNISRHPRIAYNSTNDEYVCVYPEGGTMQCIPFKFNKSNNTFTTNTTNIKIADDDVTNVDKYDVIWNPDTSTYNLLVDGGGGGGTFPDSKNSIYSFTASATSGTASTVSYLYESRSNDDNARLHYVSGIGVFTHAENDANAIFGTATRVPKWMGIAKENITSGASGDILVLSGVYESYSGLTPRSTYYIDTATNALTTSTTSYKIGKALTASKLLITEGNVA